MKKVLFLYLVFSVNSYAITSIADFLKLPRSAKAESLSGAVVSVMGEPFLSDYNPASAGSIKNLSFNAMYLRWLGGSQSFYLSGVVPMKNLNLSSSILFLSYDKFVHYGSWGESLATYNNSEFLVRGGVAVEGKKFGYFLRRFYFGGNLNFVNRHIISENYTALGLDLGTVYRTKFKKLKAFGEFSFEDVFLNVGGAVRGLAVSGLEGYIPLVVAVGGSVEWKNLLITSEVSVGAGADKVFGFGVEYSWKNIAFARIGVNFGRGDGYFTFGIGVSYPFENRNIRVDYSVVPFLSLNTTHAFSVFADFPSVSKSDAEIYYQKGIFYFVNNDYKNARKMWNKALELDPDNELIRRKLKELDEIEKMERELGVEETSIGAGETNQ